MGRADFDYIFQANKESAMPVSEVLRVQRKRNVVTVRQYAEKQKAGDLDKTVFSITHELTLRQSYMHK